MFRLGCAVASLWLLLILSGYRHEIFAPARGRGTAKATAGGAQVCEMPVFASDAVAAREASSACSRRPAHVCCF